MKENIHKLFENWNETIIWACLHEIMGKSWKNKEGRLWNYLHSG